MDRHTYGYSPPALYQSSETIFDRGHYALTTQELSSRSKGATMVGREAKKT